MNNPISNPKEIDPVGKLTLEIISQADHFNKWMYSSIRPFLKGEILEIGSGIGNISKFLIATGFDTTLSDYNSEYCEQLKEFFSDKPHVKNILQIDLQLPGFTNAYASLKEKFDTLVMLNVIEHLENDSEAIANCRYMLKPGGNLVVLAPAYSCLYCRLDQELGHYRRYTSKKMKMVFKKESFDILKTKYFNLLGVFGWFFFGKILRRKTLGTEMNTFNRIVLLAKAMDKITFRKLGLSVIVIGIKRKT